MATCQHCGAFVLLPYKCRYCGLELCSNCRLPPDHDCAGIGSWKSTSAPHALVKRDDPRFYPPDNDILEYSPRHRPIEGEVRPEKPSLWRRLKKWVRHQNREIAYKAWRFSRYIRKNWFWILAFILAMYFYWAALIPRLM